MALPTCHINALLACAHSNDQFNQQTIARLAPAVAKVISNSGLPVQKALFIYYASSEEDCKNKLLGNIQTLFKNITVECISPGMEFQQISNALCLVVGGGDLQRLKNKMSMFAALIWQKILSGVPYIGINAGAEFLSPLHLPFPDNPCDHPVSFPLQFISDYKEDAAGLAEVDALLTNNPGLTYALCMPETEEGGGILLQDAETGLAGGHTDSTGVIPQKELYIFTRSNSGQTVEVQWTEAQREDLPINYW